MKKAFFSLLLLISAAIILTAGEAAVTAQGTLVKDGFHNAFPSIVEFKGNWYMSHRRATGHRRRDGKIPVYRSTDRGKTWKEIALFQKDKFDMRDPRLAVVNGKLTIYAGYTFIMPDKSGRHGVFAFRSADGSTFEEFKPTGFADNSFFWGCLPYKKGYVATAYHKIKDVMYACLYRSNDGENWQHFLQFPDAGSNEVSMSVDKSGELYCIVRRAVPGDVPLFCHISENGMITRSIELSEPLQGVMLQSIGNEFIVAARHWKWRDTKNFKGRVGVKNDLFIMDKNGKLTFQQTIRSDGDCSYTFCVPDQANEFYAVYYSQHDYMARFLKEKNANPLTDKRPADICFARIKYTPEK